MVSGIIIMLGALWTIGHVTFTPRPGGRRKPRTVVKPRVTVRRMGR